MLISVGKSKSLTSRNYTSYGKIGEAFIFLAFYRLIGFHF
jgi:hypothetical protein